MRRPEGFGNGPDRPANRGVRGRPGWRRLRWRVCANRRRWRRFRYRRSAPGSVAPAQTCRCGFLPATGGGAQSCGHHVEHAARDGVGILVVGELGEDAFEGRFGHDFAQAGDGIVGHHAAFPQYEDGVGHLLHNFEDVGAVEDHLPARGEGVEQAAQDHGGVDVEAGEGFVEDEQFGVVEERGEEEDLLAHALGVRGERGITAREAMDFFHAAPRLVQRLKVLDDVGLGYLRLGQSATTLSGGEAQRVKLASHLATASNAGTLFICDEPTTGLHFDDIAKLLGTFQKLISNGGSLIVIEHNLDVIKAADWVIDLGPEGGGAGGRVVAAGTPETVAGVTEGYTGRYLREALEAANRSEEHT